MHSQDRFKSTQQAVINNCVSWGLKKTLTLSVFNLETKQNYYWKCKTHIVCFNQCPTDKAKVAQLHPLEEGVSRQSSYREEVAVKKIN